MTVTKKVLVIGDGFLDHGVAQEPSLGMTPEMHALSSGRPAVRGSHLVTLTGGVWSMASYLQGRLPSELKVTCVPDFQDQYAFTDMMATPPRNFVDLRLKPGEMKWNSEAKRWLSSESKSFRITDSHGTEQAGELFLERFRQRLGTDTIIECAKDADILIISDRNMYFRRMLAKEVTCQEKIRNLLDKYRGNSGDDPGASPNKDRLVVVEVTDPDKAFLKLVELLDEYKLLDRAVFVLSTNSIRISGADQKDELSLENTVESFVHHVTRQMQQNESLFHRLSKARRVIIRVGIRAAIIWRPASSKTNVPGVEPACHSRTPDPDQRGPLDSPSEIPVGTIELVYPTDAYSHMLGAGIESSDLGAVYGYTSLVTAEFVIGGLTSNCWNDCYSGIANGLLSCKEHFLTGLGGAVDVLLARKETLKAPSPEKFKVTETDFWVIKVPSGHMLRNWTILGAVPPAKPVGSVKMPAGKLPYEIVHRGIRALRDFGIPVAKYVDLQTADREEIERYSVIASLVSKYIETSSWRRPLCLAVFGPPGCGKSFGISQVANSITALKPESRLTPMPFNLSQMRSVDSLARAFHQVRNRGLAGDMPLVLLDEFDSGLNGEEFGWLKYLLAPMQDGQFLDGDEILHLPRCVIVCIGGQNRDFKELEGRLRHKGFIDAKGRDFVSRLRCNLEIKGPDAYYRKDDIDGVDPEAEIGQVDRLVRRAMLLRSTLEQRLPGILQEVKVDGKVYKQANIDDAVIQGFLTIPEYKHGVRSLEAIVEMSRALVTRRCFLKSSLPPEEQLDMHVDARKFLDIVREWQPSAS